jgi:hypothetical protein
MAAISTPAIVVNNTPVGIKPNSFTYTEGFGERNVRTASAGGSAKETVVSENVETQMSTVKFTLFTTTDNLTLARQWANNKSSNVIEASDTGFTRSFTNAIITNDFEVNAGVDGEFELEFKSDSAV